MRYDFKMNTVSKLLTVLIIGYFVFELLFGIITGNFGPYGNVSDSGAHGHHGAASGLTFDMFINALMLLLIKLLVVLLFIVLIAGAAMWIRDIWDSGQGAEQNKPKENRDMHSLLIVAAATFGILILWSIITGLNYSGAAGAGAHGNISHAASGAGFLDAFVSILMYITAIVLGIELFSYITRKNGPKATQGPVNNKNKTGN